MEKPKKFFWVEYHRKQRPYQSDLVWKTYHAGRVEFSASALTALIWLFIGLGVVSQIVVSIITVGTNWVPAIVFGSVTLLIALIYFIRCIITLIQWFRSEITVHGPGRD